MKKYMLCFVCLLLLLTACQQSDQQSAESPQLIEANEQKIPSSKDNLTISTKKEQYNTTDQTITVLFQNNSDKEFTYGAAFSLEKNIDGTWYSLPFKEGTAFIEIAYILPAHKTTSETYSLALLKDKLSAGHYRIVQQFGSMKLAAPFEMVD